MTLIPSVNIQAGPLDAELLRQAAKNPKSGAVVIFEGCARDHSMGKRVTELSYSAFEPMALAQLEIIRNEAVEKFSLDACFIHHRVGTVPLAEAAVAIACASSHRAESLQATEWLLNELKKRVPIWKREHYSDGQPSWIEGENRY
ncbi:MAG: molybdenum cofactor biosynthesis protein MoaE [Holophagaceae bacterium]|nr:molybdenum cofactor biosynthesis protein MoaE [Holophagaceae bacterium]